MNAVTVGPYQYQITVPGGSENDGKHAVPLPCGQFSLKIQPQPMVEKRPQLVVGIWPQPDQAVQLRSPDHKLWTRNCNSQCQKLGLQCVNVQILQKSSKLARAHILVFLQRETWQTACWLPTRGACQLLVGSYFATWDSANLLLVCVLLLLV